MTVHLPIWLRGAAAALVAGGLVFLIAIAAGTFDPQPVGTLVDETQFSPLTLVGGEEALLWLDTPAGVRSARSWQLTAAHTGGERDSGYGLVVGDEERALVVAVSPLGYAAIWEQDATGATTAVWLPWQPWPHVQTGNAANEIWLDLVPNGENDRLAVRVNRELLWQGSIARLGGHVGRWAASYGGETSLDFQRLRRFDGLPTVNATE